MQISHVENKNGGKQGSSQDIFYYNSLIKLLSLNDIISQTKEYETIIY